MWTWKWLIAGVIGAGLLFVLAGCSSMATWHPKPGASCPPIREYSATELKEVAGELRACKKCSGIRGMLGDYGVLRDQLRAAAE